MLKSYWLKEEKVQERNDRRTMVQTKLWDMGISSKDLVEVEHVEPYHDEVIFSDNQFEHVDQSIVIYILAKNWEVIKSSAKLGFDDAVAYALLIASDDPTFYKETINSKKTKTIAIQEELKSL